MVNPMDVEADGSPIATSSGVLSFVFVAAVDAGSDARARLARERSSYALLAVVGASD